MCKQCHFRSFISGNKNKTVLKKMYNKSKCVKGKQRTSFLQGGGGGGGGGGGEEQSDYFFFIIGGYRNKLHNVFRGFYFYFLYSFSFWYG